MEVVDNEHSTLLDKHHAAGSNADNKPTDCEQKQTSKAPPATPAKQIGLVFIVLFGQFCALCLDTFIFPFFPVIATKKGLTEFHFGLVYSAYEFARFITSPIYGSLVRAGCRIAIQYHVAVLL